MIDTVIIIGYFAVMLAVGWKSRKQSADSYWVAGRKYGTGRITASLVATIFGASSTIGIIGLGYARGLTASWWLLVGAVALIPFGLFLASRIRKLAVYTLPDILKSAYGEKVAIPAALMIAVAWCGIVAAQMIAGGRLINAILPVDFNAALLITAVVFVLYTFWGGQISVIRTDFWQLALFIGSLVLVLIMLVGRGGGNQLWQNMPTDFLSFPTSDNFSLYDLLVYYPLIVGLPYLVGPDIYSRAFCARDGKIARRAALFAAIIIIPLAFLLALIGMTSRVQFPGIVPESALPETINSFIPVGLKGLIIAGFLSAIMSSADTCLISASTIITLNVVKPIMKTAENTHLRLTRVILLAVGIVGWLIATFQQGIISSLLMGYTIFVGGVVFPTLASFYKDRLGITSTAALWAVIIGGGTAILGKISDGSAMKFILTDSGIEFLEKSLGQQSLSILPIVLSLLTLVVLSRIKSNRRK